MWLESHCQSFYHSETKQAQKPPVDSPAHLSSSLLVHPVKDCLCVQFRSFYSHVFSSLHGFVISYNSVHVMYGIKRVGFTFTITLAQENPHSLFHFVFPGAHYNHTKRLCCRPNLELIWRFLFSLVWFSERCHDVTSLCVCLCVQCKHTHTDKPNITSATSHHYPSSDSIALFPSQKLPHQQPFI